MREIGFRKEYCTKSICIIFSSICIIFLIQNTINGAQDEVTDEVLETRIGYAVYYKKHYDGKRTASGIIFSNENMVAAHPKYPLGTIVKVTNLSNQQSIVVTIIDRGISEENQRSGIIIDLSQRAATILDFIEKGRVKVKVEVLQWGNSNILRAEKE